MPANTEREIKLAITRIRHGKQKRIAADRKFSIAAVAAEAGVSNATIHNRYPQLAEHIRKLQKEDIRSEFTARRSENDALKRQIKDLRALPLARENEVKKIAIVNLQMAQQVKCLKVEVASKRSAHSKIVQMG
ncbi:hypothetical protein ACFOY5_21010 [Massilia aurea]|uniref:hypothetical protein n=1 Tax=Massilia aurea TaxID=373040 RepID=UPI00216272CC|nr:hypothetical protein [Massilia aurea]MCS0709974.1 hypothetical protein [Massilia aurea]